MAPKQSKVFIIDDDTALLESLSVLVQFVVGHVECYSSPSEFLTVVDSSCPACVVTDLRMPGMTGLELQAALTTRELQLPVIVLTGHGDVSAAVHAMKCGAVNFLEKSCPAEVLTNAIREALELAHQRFCNWQQRRDFYQRLKLLTPAEQCVLAAMVRGRSNREIADAMDVSQRTVQFRRFSLLQKFGMVTREELMELVNKIAWTPKTTQPPAAEAQ